MRTYLRTSQTSRGRQYLVGVAALLICATAVGHPHASTAVGSMAPAEPWPAHPRRLIVAYHDTVSQCAHCLLGRKQSFAAVTGAGALDRLHDRFGVESARALFFEHHGSPVQRRAAFDDRLSGIRVTYGPRNARAPFAGNGPDLTSVFVLELRDGADVHEAAAAFAADPDVAYAEPDYVMRATLAPDDPYFSTVGSVIAGAPDLWGLHAIGAPAAWDLSDGQGVTVAVIDTGIKERHEDIFDRIWTNPGEGTKRNRVDDDGNGFVDDLWGWDFTRNRNKPRDRHGHGSHVAGTIAASGNNGVGVVGLAHGARVMSVQGLDRKGEGFASDLAEAILYAAGNGADVLNNSWGGPASTTVANAVATARSLGAVVVFAAGNDSSDALGPAGDPNVIAVSSSEYDDGPAAYSNYGTNVSVAAPGSDVLSISGSSKVGGVKLGRGYRVLSGTSMAAPHTSAAAALLLADDPTLTAEQVRWHLELSAMQLGVAGYENDPWNPFLGWGRIDAERMFDEPPVTTRIREAPGALHVLPDIALAGIAALDLQFTTLDPVAWTLSSPSWLTAQNDAGSGSATIELDYDGAGLAPGEHEAAIAVSAPAAADGGAASTVSVFVHPEQRVGPQIVVDAAYDPWGSGVPAAVGSDGSGVLAAWLEWELNELPALTAAYVDDSGQVTGPQIIYAGPPSFFGTRIHEEEIEVVFDGTSFLVTWIESLEQFAPSGSPDTQKYTRVRALRLDAQLQPLDAQPALLAQNLEDDDHGGYDQYWQNLDVGFDGATYSIIWRQLDFGSSAAPVKVFMARLALNGVPIGAVQTIAPTPGSAPHIGCRAGVCMLAWVHADGETTPLGKLIHKLHGRRYVAGAPIDAASYQLASDVNLLRDIATGTAGWFFAGSRFVRPTANEHGWVPVGARVAADGTPLDPDGIRLSNDGNPAGYAFQATPTSAVFDGTQYIVTWPLAGPEPDSPLYYPMATRVGLDGTVLDAGPDGLLLAPTPTVHWGDGRLAVTATKSLLFWYEPYDDVPGRILAQGVFER